MRLLINLALLLALGIGAFFFQREIRVTFHEVARLVAPCTLPVTYTLGSIDANFGIKTEQLQEDVRAAAKLWNDAAGKKLIEQSPNGVVSVDLHYDIRQETTTRLKVLGITIDDDRTTYNVVKSKYDTLFATYDAKKRDFENRVSAFNVRETAYEKNISYWNSRGGAPKDEFARLRAEQEQLAALSQGIKTLQADVNSDARDINDLAVELNHLIDVLNIDAKKYNATGAKTGGEFEEGLYERTLGKESITIFEYDNKAHLIRVLAHELGHALGLDHVDDPEAVMYYLNKGTNVALSKADTNALKALCRM